MKNDEYGKVEAASIQDSNLKTSAMTTAARLHNLARDWSVAKTPGKLRRQNIHNPIGVAKAQGASSRRSRGAATLGFVAQPLRGCGVLVVILALSWVTFSQTSASLKGHVTDQNGAGVARADVHLRSRFGAHSLVFTDDKGDYWFGHVPPGDYILEVDAKSFASFTSSQMSIGRGQSLTHDVQLSVAAVSENVVVTATGTAQRSDEISKAVSVLNDQSIEAKRELTLPESLRGIPGVRVQQQGSFGALTTVRLRGLRNFDTAILLDGMRVRDASDINGSAAVVIPDLLPTDLDRVEILRGSGSSIYGTNAIGGVINLVPQTGAGDPHFQFGFDGGSLALYRERIRGSGGLGRRAGFSFGLTRMDVRRGVDGNDQYGNTSGAGRWQFQITPSLRISANFYATISNARLNDNPFALPGAFTGGELYPRAVAGTTFHPDFNNPDEGRRNRVLIGSVRLTHQLAGKISYSVAYQRVTNRRRNYNGPRIDPAFAAFYPFGDFEFLSLFNGQTDTFDARANLQLGESNLATVGFEFENESMFQRFMSAFGAPDGTTDRQRTFAVFGQDQIFLLDDRLQFSLGVRGQFFRIRAADRPGFLAAITPENSLTGDGSIAYFFRSTGTKLRAHAGNGFRAPSLFERFGQGTFAQIGFTRFGDPTLRAEQSIGFDAGVDQRIARDRARFGATYFYTRLQRVVDFKSFLVDPLGLGRSSGFVNQPGGISRGIETYVEAAPFRGADWRASYTFTNSDRFVPALGLQPQYVIPKHLFGMTLTQRYRSFLFSFDLNRTGAYLQPIFENDFPFRTAELTFPGYTKADLFGSYERKLSEKVSATFFAGVENLFDARYFENGFRAPGVLARGGANFRF